MLSEFTQYLLNYLANDLTTQSLASAILKNPFSKFQQGSLYLNYPDAVHYQRGLNNIKVRGF
jgi:hypothetical protein